MKVSNLLREVEFMHLCEKYIECLKKVDAAGMASLFAEDAFFYDAGPAKMGMDPISIRGRENIKAFFEQVFSSQGPVQASNVLINGNAMRYDIELMGRAFSALSVLEEENGLILELKIEVL